MVTTTLEVTVYLLGIPKSAKFSLGEVFGNGVPLEGSLVDMDLLASKLEGQKAVCSRREENLVCGLHFGFGRKALVIFTASDTLSDVRAKLAKSIQQKVVV